MKQRIKCRYISDSGSRAGVNQDAFYVSVTEELSVFCVADGMGGHFGGELASGAIISSINNWQSSCADRQEKGHFNNIIREFEDAVKEANDIIYEQYNRNAICGSTLVGMIIRGKEYVCFSAGDSRLYRFRGFTVEQITRDDIWENQAEIRQKLSKDEIEENPNKGKLTKAVGINSKISLYRVTGRLKRGDRFLLCSDGVYKCCSEKFLKRVFRKRLFFTDKAMKKQVQKLQNRIEKTGAPDNYTAVFIKVG